MTKHLLTAAWLLVSLPAITAIIACLGYSAGHSAALAVSFLPVLLAARYFVPQLSLTGRWHDLHNALFLAAALFVMQYLLLMLTACFVIIDPDAAIRGEELSSVIYNPIVLLHIIVPFTVAGLLVERRFTRNCPYDDTIAFVSNRRRVTLDPAEIVYVESNDDEVWIRTASGVSYRTRTRISQWENLLDCRFLRVHRSFIVNTLHIAERHAGRIVVADRTIEISRKYRDDVRRRFSADAGVQSGAGL